jgi:hypothetical protein
LLDAGVVGSGGRHVQAPFVCVDPLRLEQKNRQQAGGFVKAVLFVSAPPDRLRRGIEAAEKEHRGTNHALKSTKTGQIPPSVIGPASIFASTTSFNKQSGPAKGNRVEMTAKATDYQQAARDSRRSRWIAWDEAVSELGQPAASTGPQINRTVFIL